MFIYCTSPALGEANNELICNGGIQFYTDEELAIHIHQILAGQSLMMSESDFDVVLLASISVLFTAWALKRVIALIR